MNVRKECIPTRAVLWIMLFTCTFFLYMIRNNLSIIILAMVVPNRNVDNSISIPECSRKNHTHGNVTDNLVNMLLVPDYGQRFEWDTKLQGMLLGAYFWGFALTGIPGGALAERFGPAKCVTISFVGSGILTLLGSWAANVHPFMLIGSRFFIGLLGGVVYPSLHCLVSRWVPPVEKGKFVSALLGGSLGTVVTWPMLGVVIEIFGWNWAFISCGTLVLCWTMAWFCLVSDSPKTHPWISDEEKKYILDSLSGTVEQRIKELPPYRNIFSCIPFWALTILHFGNLWGLFFLMTAGPNFMSSVLAFDLGHTGLLAALPYLARLIFGGMFGQLGDFIMQNQWMKKTTIRKTFTIFSHIFPGILLFCETLSECDVTCAIVLITMSLGLNGASSLTNLQNSHDLSPNFAGTLYGIINCVGSTTGFISPLIVGYVTAESNGLDEWHKIFYIGSSVYIVCGITFLIFGSGNLQPWNSIEDKSKDTTEITNISSNYGVAEIYREIEE